MWKLILTIKYFLQGDNWKDASEFADYITRWTKKGKSNIKTDRSFKKLNH